MLDETLRKIFSEVDNVLNAIDEENSNKNSTYSYVKSTVYKNGKKVESSEKEIVNGKTTINKQMKDAKSIGKQCACHGNDCSNMNAGCKCNEKQEKMQSLLDTNRKLLKENADLLDKNQELVKVNRELAQEVKELKAKMIKIKELF